MTDRDPELARMLEQYRRAKAPQPEIRQRVWSAVETETSAGPEGGSAPSHGGALKLVVLATALVGLGGLWIATEDMRSPSGREPAAEPTQPAAVAAARPPAASAPPAPADAISLRDHAMPQPEATQSAAASAASQAAVPTSRAASRARDDRTEASALAEELELLTAAQRAAQRGRSRAALALLGRHARRFPEGAMTEEREAERVAALCALGREAEAQRVAQAFLVSFAGSPQSARVSRACDATEPSP